MAEKDGEEDNINEVEEGGDAAPAAAPAPHQEIDDDTIGKLLAYFKDMFSVENFVYPA